MPSPSKAQAGRGAKVSIGPAAGTSSPTFVLIGEVAEAGLNPPTWGTDDVTNLDSLNDGEFLTTIREGGETSLTINRVGGDAGQIALLAASATGALYMFKIEYPKSALQTTVGDADSFNALVLSAGDRKISPKSKISLTIKLKISGQVTETAGS